MELLNVQETKSIFKLFYAHRKKKLLAKKYKPALLAWMPCQSFYMNHTFRHSFCMGYKASCLM